MTSPLAQGYPLYQIPVPRANGAAIPAPASWVAGAGSVYFACQRAFTGARYYHPNGWWNYWWAATRSSDGTTWGWVPQVFFRGGANDEQDGGLDACSDSFTLPGSGSGPSGNPTPSGPGPAGAAPRASLCDLTPASSTARVRASLPAGRSRTIRRSTTTRYGRKVAIQGSLARADGTPITGAQLCVSTRRAGSGGAPEPVASVVTDAAGRFAYVIPPGPSRRVWFVYRTGRAAAAASVTVHVRAPVALRASRKSLHNGQTVMLRGRLRGARRGVLVELQAQRGRRWQTFATTRAGKRGRFHYAYRFTRTVGVQRYRLRARVGAQLGSPFANGASKPVLLRVRG
jgi:hypothetical protein